MQCDEEFKKVCQFCNEDIVMKCWVVGINQSREKLGSLNLHLTKKHEVDRNKRMMFLVGDLSLKEQEFLELFVWNGILSTLEATLLQMFVVLLWQEVSFRKRAFEAFKPYQLKQHVRIHTKEKPYNFEICQCKIRLKYHIHRHKRRKHWHEKRFLL